MRAIEPLIIDINLVSHISKESLREQTSQTDSSGGLNDQKHVSLIRSETMKKKPSRPSSSERAGFAFNFTYFIQSFKEDTFWCNFKYNDSKAIGLI